MDQGCAVSGRIDHAAEASKHIDGVHEWQEHEGATDATLVASAILAQAEATLHLSEQQRIANLIALAESGRTTLQGARAALDTLYVGMAEGTARAVLHPDVAATLGIEVTE